MSTFKRAAVEFSEDKMTDWAASLTYYGLLSLFPALIALVSIIGLVADPKETTRTLTEMVANLSPDGATSSFTGPINSIASSHSSSGLGLVIGLVLAVWSASGYVGALGRSANVIYETHEGRPFWQLRPVQLLVTLILILILAALAIGLVMTGPVVSAVAEPLGINSSVQSIWNIAKWPVMLVLVLLMFAVLYHSAPNVKMPSFSLITPGAVAALGIWILASVLFSVYVANFGSYNETYGTLGGFVALLVWFWISNLAVLFGMELNSEFERNREISDGIEGADREIQLESRSEPRQKRTV